VNGNQKRFKFRSLKGALAFGMNGLGGMESERDDK